MGRFRGVHPNLVAIQTLSVSVHQRKNLGGANITKFGGTLQVDHCVGISGALVLANPACERRFG
jgi:hypothetical protein